MDKSKWEVNNMTFGEVFDLFMGRTPSRDNDLYWQNGKYEWLSIGDMGDTKYLSKTKEKVSEEAIVNMQLVPENTVVMSFKLSIGKVGITSIPLYTNEAIMAFPPKKGYHILPTYLYYYLQAYKWQPANRAVMGKTLNKSVISGAKISIPPVEDQQRIVAELDCLNEMIALKQEQLKEFDKLAQSIFYDMFGECYETKDLGEFCEVGTGATPDRKKEAVYYGGNINWVKTTEVHNSDIYETEERITDIALEQTNCKVYSPGTILMAMYGQGKTRGQVARLMTKAATNQACAAIIPDTKKCNKDYLYVYLLLSYERIRSMARGGNQANLNLGLVKKISVPLPSLALQQQFAEKIQAIEAQKELVKQSIAETQHLFDSRMDYYFN